MRKKSLLTTRTQRNSIEIDEKSGASLTAKEKLSISNRFPDYDRNIQYFAFGEIFLQEQHFESGIFAISNHYIGFFSQKKIQGKIKKIAFFNILSVLKVSISTSSMHQKIIIDTETNSITFFNGPALTVGRLIFRNYSFATFPISQDKKITFFVSDLVDLPQIQFPLSVSQIFQFRFAALCSQNELEYDHNVVKYFHTLIQSHNPVFNLKHLPKTLADQNLSPILMALTHIPAINGISCCNTNLPSLLYSLAPLIQESCYIRKIKIKNCNTKDGLLELSKAIENNDKLPLEQIFIDQNELEDLSPFIHSISMLNTNSNRLLNLTHFSISGCGLSKETSEYLCSCLNKFESFQSLYHLGVGGLICTEVSSKDFLSYLKKNKNLKSLDLSRSSSFSAFLASVQASSIKTLDLSECDFDDLSVEQLNVVAPYLESLDISETNLSYYEISDVISFLGKSTKKFLKNESKSFLTIKLNGLNFEKERSLLIIRGFLMNDLNKWKQIEMDETRISSDEIIAFQALFLRMEKLEFLSLSSNFNESNAQAVSMLTELPSLKTLRLANTKLSSIFQQILSYLSNSNITAVDFSGTDLSDDQIMAFLSITNLKKVKINGINFLDANAINDSASEIPHLTRLPFNGALVTLKSDNMNDDKISQASSNEFNNTNEPNMNKLSYEQNLQYFKNKNGYSKSRLIDIMNFELRKSNVTQHSCVCEDMNMPYPFISQFYDNLGVEICDPNVYNTFHANLLAIEKGEQPHKIKNVLNYPSIVEEKIDNDYDDSDTSIDKFMNEKLISTLSDTMFAGLGGVLSDSSSDLENEHLHLKTFSSFLHNNDNEKEEHHSINTNPLNFDEKDSNNEAKIMQTDEIIEKKSKRRSSGQRKSLENELENPSSNENPDINHSIQTDHLEENERKNSSRTQSNVKEIKGIKCDNSIIKAKDDHSNLAEKETSVRKPLIVSKLINIQRNSQTKGKNETNFSHDDIIIDDDVEKSANINENAIPKQPKRRRRHAQSANTKDDSEIPIRNKNCKLQKSDKNLLGQTGSFAHTSSGSKLKIKINHKVHSHPNSTTNSPRKFDDNDDSDDFNVPTKPIQKIYLNDSNSKNGSSSSYDSNEELHSDQSNEGENSSLSTRQRLFGSIFEESQSSQANMPNYSIPRKKIPPPRIPPPTSHYHTADILKISKPGNPSRPAIFSNDQFPRISPTESNPHENNNEKSEEKPNPIILAF